MNEKRALVLSGGGSKGAYSVGVVKALLESGRQYDVIAGVSVGALIGASLAMSLPSQQWADYKRIERIFTESVKGDHSIYKPWAPGFLTYIWSLWKGGIYSMRPLRDILQNEFIASFLHNSNVIFYVGVVSLQSGQYKSVQITHDMDNEKAVDWIWASAIFPILFPAVEIDGEQWLDGGVRDVIPAKDILLKHPDVTHIDAVITTPREGYVAKHKDKYLSIVNVALRGAELLADEVYASDLESICAHNNVQFNIYDPEDQVNDDSFRFDPEEIRTLIERGYQDTKAKLAQE